MKHLYKILFWLLIAYLFCVCTCLQASTVESAGTFYRIQNPFSIGIDPMLRLLLINFENDPDSIYIGFEPQVFDDTVNGTGHLVIGWRKDGRVDVYCQPGLHPNPAKYDIAGKGLANMIIADLDPAILEVGERGVQAHYGFIDLQGREIELNIAENHTARRKPFGLLAPMGSSAENPSSLPLIMLHDFYFVRQVNTAFQIRIGERIHKPDKLPMLIDWRKQYFTRYSRSPLIATLNPDFNGLLSDIQIDDGSTTEVKDGDLRLKLSWKSGVPAISKIIRDNDIHPIEMAFEPPFPALDSILPQANLKGSFQISAHHSTGRIGGLYTIRHDGENILLTLQPSKGWKPKADKPSLRFLYSVARIFKTWPKTYLWQAKLSPDAGGNRRMQSKWSRLK